MAAMLPDWVSEHPLARLGSSALAALAAPSTFSAEESTARARLDQLSAVFKVSKDSSTALNYPFEIRQVALSWAETLNHAQLLIEHGRDLGVPFGSWYWLCVSALQASPATCYRDLAASLFALADFVGAPQSWSALGVPPLVDGAATAAAQKKRDQSAKQLAKLALALLLLFRGSRLPPDTDEGRQLRGILQAQPVPDLQSCAAAARRLDAAVVPWLGAVNSFALLAQEIDGEVGLRSAASPGPEGPAETARRLSPASAATATGQPATPASGAQPTPQGAAGAAVDSAAASPSMPRGATVSRGGPAAAASAAAPPPAPAVGSEDFRQPWLYVWRRAALWGQPILDPKKSDGPTAEEAEQILKNVEGLAPLEALAFAEELLVRYPLWLDLQPRVALWLDSLAAPQARDAVRYLVAMLATHSPELLEARLRTNVAVASDETREFLRGEVARFAAIEPLPPLGAAMAVDLDGVSRRLRDAASAKERFLLRLEVGRLCRQETRWTLSVAFLTACLEDVERFGLLDWEPDLVRGVLSELVELSQVRGSPVAREVQDKVRVYLCRVDPRLAEQFT